MTGYTKEQLKIVNSSTFDLERPQASDLEHEASSKAHQFCNYPKNPFCKVCHKARMMALPAKKKGGQKRLETKVLGIRLSLTTRLLKLMWKKASKVKRWHW